VSFSVFHVSLIFFYPMPIDLFGYILFVFLFVTIL